MTNECLVFDYLESNQGLFKETQAPLLEKRRELHKMESVVFHRDISDQYESRIRSNMTNEICSRLALDYETVFGVIEDLNLEEYLK